MEPEPGDETLPGGTSPTEADVLGVLRGVIDPELGTDIVELGMARAVAIDDDGRVDVTIALTTSGCPLRAQIQRDVRARVADLPGVSSVHLSWDELNAEEKATAMARARFNVSRNAPDTEVPATTKVLMVASGKGGVGKSSVTVNLAAAMAASEITLLDDGLIFDRALESIIDNLRSSRKD